MGSLIGGSKKGGGVTTGFRYYFSVLAGICRGPVDEVFLIKSGGYVFWDGSATGPMLTADKNDPASPYSLSTDTSGFLTGYPGGTLDSNTMVPISKPDMFGGDKGEGGLDGILWLYMGAKDQVIAASEYIRLVMSGLRLSHMRGVLTSFFDGEITANNPYPKTWNYRVRRALKGWDGDVWYPERAVIKLTDPSIPIYGRGAADTGTSFTTIYYNDDGVALGEGTGGSSGSSTVTEVTSNYSGAAVTTYSKGGLSTTYAVPQQYNDIRAMNPAHIIYECCTNRDWGRGMDRSLIDNLSFSDAANALYDEGFGLCMKWSRTEDVDVFVQNVIDHIGAVVYTDRITGLLCLRLIRGGYDVLSLSEFTYASGLLEVTSLDQAAQDAVANEIVVKYHSPVLDTDKQARAQNIASIDQLGSVFSVSKEYPGLPTAVLAVQVAQRDLKIMAGGYKRIEFKLDRRAYTLVPGDVIKVHAPERGVIHMVVRVATVEDSVMTDGSITVVGGQDVYGLPTTPPVMVQEVSTFQDPLTLPLPITVTLAGEASYRDAVKYLTPAVISQYDNTQNENTSFATLMAIQPTPMSLNYEVSSGTYNAFTGGHASDVNYKDIGASVFSKISHTTTPISTTDTTFVISGNINPANAKPGMALEITNQYGIDTFHSEFVRLDAISVDTTTGLVTITVARGAVDTPAQAHPTNAVVWLYDDHVTVDYDQYVKNDSVYFEYAAHTSRGDSPPANNAVVMYGRFRRPYSAANFRVNGYPRDATPTQSGSLVFTWSHRNRVLQQDQLVGEMEASTGLEDGQYYQFFLSGDGGNLSTYEGSMTAIGFRGDTVTVTAGDLAAAGMGSGTYHAILVTSRLDSGFFYAVQGYRSQDIFFNYDAGTGTVTPPTSGFGTDFGNSMG